MSCLAPSICSLNFFNNNSLTPLLIPYAVNGYFLIQGKVSLGNAVLDPNLSFIEVENTRHYVEGSPAGNFGMREGSASRIKNFSHQLDGGNVVTPQNSVLTNFTPSCLFQISFSFYVPNPRDLSSNNIYLANIKLTAVQYCAYRVGVDLACYYKYTNVFINAKNNQFINFNNQNQSYLI